MSFRFHLVSLVAVFLALGLGVVIGTTVINRGIVLQLERQTDTLLETSAALRARVDELEQEVEMWAAFGGETAEHLLGGRLPGIQVVLVTQEGADGRGIDGLRRALEEAGAQVRAVLSVGRRMALEQEADRAALAAALRTTAAPPGQLRLRAAETLAARLAFGGGDDDVLARLLGAGFLVNQGPGLSEGLQAIGGQGQVFVVVAGGTAPPPLEPADFLVPLVRELVVDGGTVAAAEGMGSQYEFVRALRGDGSVSPRMVTQDNVDRTPGQVGLVLALDDLIERGRPGHYGVKDGAAGLLPEPPGG